MSTSGQTRHALAPAGREHGFERDARSGADAGPELRGHVGEVVDLVPDFDAASPTDTVAWVRAEWQAIADALGWRSALDRSLASMRVATIAGVRAAALAAFVESGVVPTEPSALIERARIRHAVLTQLSTAANPWRVVTDAAQMPSQALYRGRSRHPAAATSEWARRAGLGTRTADVQTRRVFASDVGRSYWGDDRSPLARDPATWPHPLALNLGTWPWVHGRRLGRHPTGLWPRRGQANPAALGLEIASRQWHPESHLDQDARRVAEQLAHWRAATAPLLEAVPAWPGASTATIGGLYRRGGWLHVHQGSLALVGLLGARGFIAASTFNYVQRRFAAFFTMRRALARVSSRLPTALQRKLAASADQLFDDPRGTHDKALLTRA